MKKILIVVDMQNDFIDGALGTKEAELIIPNVIRKIEAYRAEEGLVLFTRDTHGQDYLQTQEGKKLPVPHCIVNTQGWQLREEIEVRDSVVMEKPSFGSLELAQYILSQGDVESIELVGLCTDICVIANAMIIKSAMPEIQVIVDASCCAGVTVETHNNALKAMKMCQIEIVN